MTLGKGEFFGEMAVIDGSARSATAIAAAPNTRVMRINHARFVYLVSQQPAFALMVMDALSKRLRASNARHLQGAHAMSDRKPSPFPVLLDNDVCSLIQAAEDVYQIRFKNRAANAYLVRGKSRTIMIDVGLSSNYPALLECLDHVGCPPDKIDMVMLSHEHLDHIGAAYHFGGRTIIAAHRLAANKIMLRDDFSMLRKMFNEPNVPINVDIWLEEGNLIDLGNFRLNVMYTPGHTSACISLFDQDKGLLFAADTLMPGGVMGGVFGSGSISDYIQSLERLKGLNSKILLSGHGRLSDTPQDDVRIAIQRRMRCCRTPRNCSMRSTRARISSRSCSRCATSTSSTTAELASGLTNGPAVCSKASTATNIQGGANHEALRLDRTEPAHRPHVHGGKGHRDAEADRRPARRRKPRGRASEAQSARPDADARTRRRQLSLRDHRDLRISRREDIRRRR